MSIFCYQNSNLQSINRAMIRQKSVSSIKLTSKDKTHLHSNPSLKKIQTQRTQSKTNIDSWLRKTENKKIGSKEIGTKQQKINKIESKDKHQVKIIPKIKNTERSKIGENIQPILMKNDIKKMINRTITLKSKPNTIGQQAFVKNNKIGKSQKTSKQKPEHHLQKQLKTIFQVKQSKKISKQKSSKISSKRCSHQEAIQSALTKIVTSKNKRENNISNQEQRKVKRGQISQKINSQLKADIRSKTSRFSVDSIPVGVRKAQIEEALKLKPSHKKLISPVPSLETKQDQNFMQIFKHYKKSFDVDRIKIQKTNSSQSKNISSVSLLNSAVYKTDFVPNRQQKISPYMTIADRKIKQNINGNKEEYELSQQSKSSLSCRAFTQIQEAKTKKTDDVPRVEKQIAFKKTIQIGKPIKPTGNFCKNQQHHLFMIEKKQSPKLSEMKLNNSIQSNSMETNQQISCEYKIKMLQIGKSNQNTNLGQYISSGKDINIINYCEQQLYLKIQQKIGKQSAEQSTAINNKENYQELSAHCEQFDQQKIQKKFQNSKYYVQPLPKGYMNNKVEPKSYKDGRQSQISQEQKLNESLLNCQITLIQNNIIEDENELELF